MLLLRLDSKLSPFLNKLWPRLASSKIDEGFLIGMYLCTMFTQCKSLQSCMFANVHTCSRMFTREKVIHVNALIGNGDDHGFFMMIDDDDCDDDDDEDDDDDDDDDDDYIDDYDDHNDDDSDMMILT